MEGGGGAQPQRRIFKTSIRHVVRAEHLQRLQEGVRRGSYIVEVAYVFAKLQLLKRFDDAIAEHGGAFGQGAARAFADGLCLGDAFFDDSLTAVTAPPAE